MPLCRVQTNLADREIPDDFLAKLSHVLADALQKPIEWITVAIHTNVRMCKATSMAPMATVEIIAFDRFDEERNKTYTPKILDCFNKELNLPDNRIAIVYRPGEKTDVGLRQ